MIDFLKNSKSSVSWSEVREEYIKIQDQLTIERINKSLHTHRMVEDIAQKIITTTDPANIHNQVIFNAVV